MKIFFPILVFACAVASWPVLGATPSPNSVVLSVDATIYPGVTPVPFPTAGALLYTDGTTTQAAANAQIANGYFDVPYTPNAIFMELQGSPYITLRGSANQFWGADSPTVTGYANLVVGPSAGGVTSGYDNTLIGESAGAANGAGFFNTAVGAYALQNNTSQSNTAVGFEAGQYAIDATYLTAVGSGAAHLMQHGIGLTVLGAEACESAVDVSYVVCVGQDALRAHVSGNWETVIGDDAAFAEIDAQSNTIVGSGAAQANLHGGYNSIVGAQTVEAATSIYNSEIFGRFDLPDATAIENCIVIGLDVGGTGVTKACSHSTIIGNSIALNVNPIGAIILADGLGNIEADYNYTNPAKWTMASLAGTESRPVCVTATGGLEPGSLSAGLVTCP